MSINEFAQRRNNGKIWFAGYSVYGLCASWNYATRPYIPLTDAAHKRSRIYARACMNRLKRMGAIYGKHYTEFEDGSLFPLSAAKKIDKKYRK